MISVYVLACVFALTITSSIGQFDCPAGWSGRGPLYDYVYCEDSIYSYDVMEVIVEQGVTTYLINMTSQRWYDETVHNWPVWWHYMSVSVPDTVAYPNNAAIYISSGSNTDDPPNINTGHFDEMRRFANNTRMVTGCIRQTPNQPFKFAFNHGPTEIYRDRREDDLIAWTWREFLEHPEDPNILLRWPMCKGVARAMDTIVEVGNQQAGTDIQRFFVSGQSKRGWTAWLQAAIDDRVDAVAPTVLSCLNTQEVMRHYYTSLGGWPLAFGPYYAENITSWMDHPHTLLLEEMVDPYMYRENLTMPKYVVSGGSDEFFFMDDFWYWLEDMLGETNIWIIERTGHSISNSPLVDDYWTALEAFYLSVIDDVPRPQISWTRGYDEENWTGSLTVNIDPESRGRLLNITAWSYLTPMEVFPRRDFRRIVGIPPVDIDIEEIWEEKAVTDLGDGVYTVEYDIPDPMAPEMFDFYRLNDLIERLNDTIPELIPDRIDSCSSQFLGFFMKLTFEGPTPDRPLVYTTEPQILPDCMPYETCYGTDCLGWLR